MSGSILLNEKANLSMNPNNHLPNSSDLSHAFQTINAEIIQRALRNVIKHSAAQMQKTIKSQAYRVQIVKYLSEYIMNENCELLLLGSDDDEILKTFSPYDKSHVRIKTLHIIDALQYLIDCTIKEKAITWDQCCEVAIQKNYYKIKSSRTVAGWYLDLHNTTQLKFCRSTRGRKSYFAKSPFAEDESLMVMFKSWARQDIEHLTIQKTTEFVTNKLLCNWTAAQLQTHKTAFPVSEYVVSRWMKEAGLKYEKHKNHIMLIGMKTKMW